MARPTFPATFPTTSHPRDTICPYRLSMTDRPVLAREQAHELAKHVLSMSATDTASVIITHTAQSITRLSTNRVRNAESGDGLQIFVISEFGNGNGNAVIVTNQLDDRSLRDAVARADALSRGMIGWSEKITVHPRDEQDTYPAGQLYHPSSVDALHDAREAAVPAIVSAATQEGMRASGFIGVMARAEAYMNSQGIFAFSEETDCEVAVTVRPPDDKSSGWSGAAARAWSAIDPSRVAREAVEMAKRNVNVHAVEPGRRTAILSPAAVVQLMRFFVYHFDGLASDEGRRGFSKFPDQPKGSKFNQRLFDPRIRVTTDPTDPDGGFKPWFGAGYVSHPTTWVENGTLKYLGYNVNSLSHGKPYAEMPFGFRLHGGETTLEEMIAQCEDGIYVNRFSDVDILDWRTGMMTGVTCDGCFLVRNGKIDRPVKNFRFLTSPFFFLNNVIAMGPTQRTAFGYAPWTEQERAAGGGGDDKDWPRRPMIVPPIMVRDFNFSALIDSA